VAAQRFSCGGFLAALTQRSHHNTILSAMAATHDGGDCAIKVSNLNFRYENSQALHDVSFEVKRGSRVALLGANGAGKSTLLRILGRSSLPRWNCTTFVS
jgi:ABC-type transport system involved in cytochrome bd biosynthesis fused ATPase/permease subunit